MESRRRHSAQSLFVWQAEFGWNSLVVLPYGGSGGGGVAAASVAAAFVATNARVR